MLEFTQYKGVTSSINTNNKTSNIKGNNNTKNTYTTRRVLVGNRLQQILSYL